MAAKRKPLAEVIIGMGRPRPRPFDGDRGGAEEKPDMDGAKREAAEALIVAVKTGDVDGLMEALDTYHELCGGYGGGGNEEEEETEEEY